VWIAESMLQEKGIVEFGWQVRCYRVALRGTGMLFPVYIALGVLIVLFVWAVADWSPRDKL
jgi:hypothetical protein